VTESDLSRILSEVVERVRTALKPQAIYLYGSYAYGNPHPDSDLDLLVIVADSPLPFHERSGQAYRALRGIEMPIDIQVYTRAEFEARAQLPVSFERTVQHKGRLLYAA